MPTEDEESAEAGYETIIVSRKPPLTASEEVIESERMERTAPKSTSETLSLVSGLRIVQHGSEGKGHQIFLRGFDAAHGSDVEVLVDGVPINEGLHVHGHGYINLYGIIPEVVGELRVSKGPFLPFQGDFAIAGTIEYRLGVAQQKGNGLVRTEVSHRGRLRSVVLSMPFEENMSGFVAAEAVYDSGFGPDRESSRAVVNAHRRWSLDNSNSLSVLLIGLASRFESPGAVRLEDISNGDMGFYETYGPPGQGVSDMAMLRIGWERKKPGTKIGAFVYGLGRRFGLVENFTGWLLDGDQGDRRSQVMDAGTGGAKLSIDYRLPAAIPLSLTTGLGWQLDAAVQQERHIEASGSTIEGNRDIKALRHHIYGYSGLRMAPVSWIEILPSARLDVFAYNVEDRLTDRKNNDAMLAFSPRITTAFPVHEWWTLFAAYGRGLRSPEARSITATPAGVAEDVALSKYDGGKAEISKCDSFEVGISLSPSRIFSAQTAAFATWIDKEVVFDHVANLNLELNSTRRLGFEGILRLNPSDWLAIQTDVTYVDARFSNSEAPIPGTAKWQGKGSVFAGREMGPRGGADLFWVGERQLAHGATVDGYGRLDLFAGWRFEFFDVTFILDNATGAKIIEGAYHYASWFDRNEPRSNIPIIHYVASEPITARLILTAFI